MKDYDIFFTEPDTVDEMYCKVCGARCKIERSVTDPTSLAEAMAHLGHWHDTFFCPHSGKPWHEDALELVQQIDATPSKRLASLMSRDLEDILKEHKDPTT